MQFLKFYKYSFLKVTFLLPTLLLFFCCFSQASYAQKKYTVVLDAGHGGKDSGNLGNGFKEKSIALRVALDVGKELLTSKDIEVHYTRKKDVFIELHNRAKVANTKKADLFVSIHCDSYTKSDPHGAGTFVLGLSGNKENLEIARKENAVILMEDDYKSNYDYDPNSPESLIGLSMLQEENLDLSLSFGGIVQDNFRGIKRFDRKVKQANFLVLRETVMPSVLIELGFLTNKAEGNFLNTRKGQIKMAKAIAKAINGYFDRLKLNTVSQSTPLEITVVNNKKANTSQVKITNTTKPKESKKKEIQVVVQKEKSTSNEVKTSNQPMKQEVKVVVEKPKNKKPVANSKPKAMVEKASIKAVPKKETSKVEDETGVLFKIQISASRVKLSLKSYNFKGLENVEMKEIDGYYKYFYGKSASFQDIKTVLSEVKATGFEDAWVVAFKNGQKISLKEALKSI